MRSFAVLDTELETRLTIDKCRMMKKKKTLDHQNLRFQHQHHEAFGCLLERAALV